MTFTNILSGSFCLWRRSRFYRLPFSFFIPGVVGFVVQVPGGEGYLDAVFAADGIRCDHGDDKYSQNDVKNVSGVLGDPLQGKAVSVLQIGERHAEAVGIGLDPCDLHPVAFYEHLHGSPAVRARQTAEIPVPLQEQSEF